MSVSLTDKSTFALNVSSSSYVASTLTAARISAFTYSLMSRPPRSISTTARISLLLIATES